MHHGGFEVLCPCPFLLTMRTSGFGGHSSTATPCRSMTKPARPAKREDQVYNNTAAPSCSAAVHYLPPHPLPASPPTRPPHTHTFLTVEGSSLMPQDLNQVQCAGPVMRSQPKQMYGPISMLNTGQSQGADLNGLRRRAEKDEMWKNGNILKDFCEFAQAF